MNADGRRSMTRNVTLTMASVAIMLGCSSEVVAAEPPAPLANLREVPFTQVRIADTFWAPRRETNRTVSLQHSLKMLEDTGAMANFDAAAKVVAGGPRDPDTFKGLALPAT